MGDIPCWRTKFLLDCRKCGKTLLKEQGRKCLWGLCIFVIKYVRWAWLPGYTLLHRTGIRPDPYCTLCSLHEPIDRNHLGHCTALSNKTNMSDTGRPGKRWRKIDFVILLLFFCYYSLALELYIYFECFFFFSFFKCIFFLCFTFIGRIGQWKTLNVPATSKIKLSNPVLTTSIYTTPRL